MKRIALVGCGRISIRHREAIGATAGIEVTVVCDIDEDRAKTAAHELGCDWVTDYREIRGVDYISVLTPSGLHPLHASEISESTDATHIIVEKPLSLTVREAHELYRRVESAGKVLLPVYQNRYNPLVAFMKKLISDGRIGRVHQFICNVLWNRDNAYFNIDWHGTKELDGGVLYTQASHYVDMIHYFFGELAESKGLGGTLRNLEVHDSISAVCKFENGVIGSLNATVNTYPRNYCTEFILVAEKGTIRLSGTNLNKIEYWDVEGIEKPDMDFTIDHVYGKGHDTMYDYIVKEQWQHFPSRADILSGIGMMEKLSY